MVVKTQRQRRHSLLTPSPSSWRALVPGLVTHTLSPQRSDAIVVAIIRPHASVQSGATHATGACWSSLKPTITIPPLDRRFSSTRVICPPHTAVPSITVGFAADKRYSLGIKAMNPSPEKQSLIRHPRNYAAILLIATSSSQGHDGLTGPGAFALVTLMFVGPLILLALVFWLASRFVRPARRSQACVTAIATILLSVGARWFALGFKPELSSIVSFGAWMGVAFVLASIAFLLVVFWR